MSTTKTSKMISHALRHSPESYGLTMSADGKVLIAEMVENMNISREDILSIVAADTKGRFSCDHDQTHIWANQGHSIDVDVSLRLVAPGEFSTVFHGTKAGVVEAIMNEGLTPQSRQFVHLSKDEDTAVIVAGRRKGESVILRVDVNAMLRDRFEVFESANGVILTKAVPARYISLDNEK